MSARDRDTASGSLYQLLDFAIEQRIKGLNTALPGSVHTYNSTTGRATVQAMIDKVLTDGRRVEAPLITNVPVLQPSVAYGYVHLPVAPGDQVWLMFAQRGIEEYKQTRRRAAPDLEALLSMKDAVAMPARFMRSGPPPTSGMVLSTHDGQTYVSIENGNVQVVSSGTVNVRAGGAVNVNAGAAITLSGSSRTVVIP